MHVELDVFPPARLAARVAQARHPRTRARLLSRISYAPLSSCVHSPASRADLATWCRVDSATGRHVRRPFISRSCAQRFTHSHARAGGSIIGSSTCSPALVSRLFSVPSRARESSLPLVHTGLVNKVRAAFPSCVTFPAVHSRKNTRRQNAKILFLGLDNAGKTVRSPFSPFPFSCARTTHVSAP